MFRFSEYRLYRAKWNVCLLTMGYIALHAVNLLKRIVAQRGSTHIEIRTVVSSLQQIFNIKSAFSQLHCCGNVTVSACDVTQQFVT